MTAYDHARWVNALACACEWPDYTTVGVCGRCAHPLPRFARHAPRSRLSVNSLSGYFLGVAMKHHGDFA